MQPSFLGLDHLGLEMQDLWSDSSHPVGHGLGLQGRLVGHCLGRQVHGLDLLARLVGRCLGRLVHGLDLLVHLVGHGLGLLQEGLGLVL